MLENSQSAKSPLRNVFPPSSGIVGKLDRTWGVWLSRVVLNQSAVSWWEQRALENCLPLQEIRPQFSFGLATACVSVDQECACTVPGSWQTIVGRRAEERQKGLIVLPHRFPFRDLPTSHNPNTTKKVWKWICIRLVHISPIICNVTCSVA